MKSSTSLSVLVPVYNEQYLIQASLERLLLLAESPVLDRIQIIVVDDGSTDGTPAAIDEFQRRLRTVPGTKMEWRFLRHDENLGKGSALRLALSQADAELAVCHDADLEN